jgi:hypothetical protein
VKVTSKISRVSSLKKIGTACIYLFRLACFMG